MGFSQSKLTFSKCYFIIGNTCKLHLCTYVATLLFLFSNTAKQSPRQFCDQRDAGMYITSWGSEKPPDVPLRCSLEVIHFLLLISHINLLILFLIGVVINKKQCC